VFQVRGVSLDSREARAVLAIAPAPAKAARLTRAQLRFALRKSGRQRNIETWVERLRTAFSGEYLHQLPLVEEAMGRHTLALVVQLDAACRAADDLGDAAAEAFTEHPDAEIMNSFPGIGPLTGARVLASGDFVPALEQILGSTTRLSPATVTRLTKQWGEDHAAFQARDRPTGTSSTCGPPGGTPRSGSGRRTRAVPVLLGVGVDGTKELIALAEELRESTESWAALLRDCPRRGVRDPELFVQGRREDHRRPRAPFPPPTSTLNCRTAASPP
jgi:Transposase, Mutator family